MRFGWVKRLLLFAVLAGAWWGVNLLARAPVVSFPLAESSEHVYIRSWRVLGPLPWTEAGTASSAAVGRQLDYPHLNRPEGELKALPLIHSMRRIRQVDTQNGLVRLHKLFGQSDFQIAYAECSIKAVQEGPAALLIEAEDGVKVWLNGELILRNADVRKIIQFDKYVRVHLKRGENHLLVKLVHTTQKDMWEPWGFAAAVRSLPAARNESRTRGVPRFIPDTVISRTQPLTVDLTIFPQESNVEFQARTVDGRIQLDRLLNGGERHRVDLGPPTDQLLGIQLRTDQESFEETVVRGMPEDWLSHYERELPPIMSTPRHRANLGAPLHRLRHLLRPGNRSPKQAIWQRKFAYAVSEIETIRHALAAGRDPYRGQPGTHLRGFVSPVDRGIQHYMVHWPATVKPGERAGLVIVVPFTEEPLRPFLESIVVAEHENTVLFDRAADRHRLAYVRMNARGNTNGQHIGFAEIMRAVEEIGRDYPIDPERLYLFGACSGGRDALALAEAYPDRFAAIATLSPATRYSVTTVSEAHRETDDYACGWLAERSPLLRLRNLAHIPLLILHGDADEHNPLPVSLDLHDRALSEQLPVEFDLIAGGTHLRFPRDPWDAAFRFLAAQRRVQALARVQLASWSPRYNRAYWAQVDEVGDPTQPFSLDAEIMGSGELRVESENVARFRVLPEWLPGGRAPAKVILNGRAVERHGVMVEPVLLNGAGGRLRRLDRPGGLSYERPKSADLPGSIGDAFMDSFVVVAGSAVEDQAHADRFVKSWKRRFFTDCPVKRDRDVNQEDISSRNLILFGSASTNAYLGRVAANLPIRYAADGVTVGGRHYTGTAFSVQAAFPNPLNPRKYVVLAGDPNCDECPSDALQFALKGWYDCAVWRYETNGFTELVDVGTFDAEWRRFLPTARCGSRRTN